MHRKNGISLLVDAPRGVKMALKEDSEGSTEQHKVITLLKLCITNLENGIWIVTWNELTWNILKTSLPLPCRDEIPEPSHLSWEGAGTSNIEREEKGEINKLWLWRSNWFFFFSLSVFPGHKCLPAALRHFCETWFCTATFFGWEWLAYISFP